MAQRTVVTDEDGVLFKLSDGLNVHELRCAGDDGLKSHKMGNALMRCS